MCSTTRACACMIEIKNGVLFYAHATLLMLAFIYIILLYLITMIWCSGIVSNCHSNHSTEMNIIVFRYVLYVCACMKRWHETCILPLISARAVSHFFYSLLSLFFSTFGRNFITRCRACSFLFRSILFRSILFYQSLFFARRNFLLFTAIASSSNTWVSH